MSWVQVSVECAGKNTSLVTAVLEAAGALSVSLQDAADELLIEPEPGMSPLWEQVRVVALYAPDVDAGRVIGQLRSAMEESQLNASVEIVADMDWSEIWRDSFTAMRFGERLWIVPSGEECPDPDAIVVALDPGLAFGTGTHATTALCLEWLDGHAPAGQTVVDYGCGSGILAIAAHKLGAARVHAVDIDPQALQSTRVNAGRNGIEAGLTVQLPDSFAPGQVDLVMANILANPLIELAGELTGYLRTKGRIVMTGILAEQAEDVMSAYRDAIKFADPVVREEWVQLAGRKR
jgi:ribosomal protein L11 methyltransferase